MRLIKFPYICSLLFSLILLSCSSSSSSGDDTPPPMGGGDDEPEVPAPSSATLVFPEDNTECNTGVVDTNDETISTVTFEWNASSNTDSYTVTVTNLNTNSSTFTNSNNNEVDISIMRGTPYSWFVTSRAQGTSETATSATFSFYNEGPGIENYAPFPAEAVSPARGENLSASSTSVDLNWSASDVDDDIVAYEVFFGTDEDPTTSIGTATETSLTDVSITSGTTYYWKIVTTDSAGNVSTSEVFQFRVG